MNSDLINTAVSCFEDDAPCFLSNTITDAEIIKLFFDRDESAISASSAKYGKYITAVAANVLGNHQDAEECVNDALLKAWESIPPASPKNFPGFLAKITKNIALNRYRQSYTEKRGNGEISSVFEELSECVPDRSSSVEQSCENKELLSEINAFLNKLASNRRDIFVLRYWYCMSVSELAVRTGMSENRVSVELSRIRRKLMNYLQKRGF